MRIEINTRTRTLRITSNRHIYNDAKFESLHPRDKDGKFATGRQHGGGNPDYRSPVPKGALAAHVEFTHLKPRLVNVVTDALQQNMKLYPFMRNHFSFIGTSDSELAKDLDNNIRPGDNTEAFYQPEPLGDRGQMCFSVKALERAEIKEKLFKIIQKYEGDFSYRGSNTPKEIVDHEFGHALWQQLGLDKSKGKSIVKYIADYMAQHSADEITQNLSHYANTAPGEFFAEAFSELRNNPHPRPVAKKIGELLDAEIKSQNLDK